MNNYEKFRQRKGTVQNGKTPNWYYCKVLGWIVALGWLFIVCLTKCMEVLNGNF